MRINALICELLSFISRDNFEVFTFTPKAIQNIFNIHQLLKES